MTVSYRILIIAAIAVLAGCSKDTGTPPGDGNGDPPDSPAVGLIAPRGGELVVDTVTVKWTAADPDPGETELLSIDLAYRDTSDASWIEIATGLANDGEFFWDAGSVPEAQAYLLMATATDTTGRSSVDSSGVPFSIVRRVIITDHDDKEWDITHAVHVYGMAVERWSGGLGKDVLRPINNPEMLSPGEDGYPGDTDTTWVVGAAIAGDSRAYPTSALFGREVINDRIGDTRASVIF